MRLVANTSSTADELDTIEILYRPDGQPRWQLYATVEAAVDNLTDWLRSWLVDTGITQGDWIAGNKWSGTDSTVINAAENYGHAVA